MSSTDVRSTRPSRPVGQTLIHIYDRLYSERSRTTLKRLAVNLSLFTFAAHIALIWAARYFIHTPELTTAISRNYLAAIQTPFNVILFYEVLTLIAALPASTTRSIVNQFEIVSLIFLRDVFKELATIGPPGWIHGHVHELMPLLTDMWAGLLMFVLATVFQQIAHRQVQMPRTQDHISGRIHYVAYKKMVATGLTVLLVSLACFHTIGMVVRTIEAAHRHEPITLHTTAHLYNDIFTVMIFTDVFVVILSLVLTGRYEMVFRNAAYVVATILIRFSLMEAQPYGAALALISALFAILTALIFNYHSRIQLAVRDDDPRVT